MTYFYIYWILMALILTTRFWWDSRDSNILLYLGVFIIGGGIVGLIYPLVLLSDYRLHLKEKNKYKKLNH